MAATLEAPAGSIGNILGPGTWSDNSLIRADGDNSNKIQGSGVIIDDADNITGVNDLAVGGNITVTGTVDGVDVSAHAARHAGAGADPITTLGAIAMTGDITMAEDGWIGIGAAAERIVFDGTGGYLDFVAGTQIRMNQTVGWATTNVTLSTTLNDLYCSVHLHSGTGGFGVWSGSARAVGIVANGTILDLYSNSVATLSIDNANGYIYTTNANLGVGIAAPTGQVHTYRNDTQVTESGVTIEQDGTGDAMLKFRLSGTENWAVGIDNDDGDKFKIADAQSLGTNDRLTIDTTGKVGIGVAAPLVTLQIGDGDAQETIMIRGGVGADRAPVLSLFYQGSREGVVAQTNSQFVIANTGGFVDYNNATLVAAGASNGIVISSTGNVGMGTFLPNAKLDVEQDTSTRIRITATTAAGTVEGLEMYAGGAATADLLYTEAGGVLSLRQTRHGTGRLDLQGAPGGIAVTLDADALGIGTTTPTVPLHIELAVPSVGVLLDNTDTNGDSWLIQSVNYANREGSLEFYNGDTAAWFTMTAAGGFGIGTNRVPVAGVGAAKLAIDGTNASTAGPHVQFTTDSDDYPLLTIRPLAHDAVQIALDAYYDGVTKSSDIGSNFAFSKAGDVLYFQANSGTAAGSQITAWTVAMQIAADAVVTFPTGDVNISAVSGAAMQFTSTNATIANDVVLGQIKFYSADASGGGAGVRSSISVYSDTAGAQTGDSSYMTFSTTNSVDQDIEHMRLTRLGGLGLGTTTVPHGGIGAAKLAIEGTDSDVAGPHVQFTTASDDYPLMQMRMYSHSYINLYWNAYWDGGIRSSSTAVNFDIGLEVDLLRFQAASGVALGAGITFVTAFQIEADAEVMFSPGLALKTYWRDVNASIHSSSSGVLDLTATTIKTNGALTIESANPTLTFSDTDGEDYSFTCDANNLTIKNDAATPTGYLVLDSRMELFPSIPDTAAFVSDQAFLFQPTVSVAPVSNISVLRDLSTVTLTGIFSSWTSITAQPTVSNTSASPGAVYLFVSQGIAKSSTAGIAPPTYRSYDHRGIIEVDGVVAPAGAGLFGLLDIGQCRAINSGTLVVTDWVTAGNASVTGLGVVSATAGASATVTNRTVFLAVNTNLNGDGGTEVITNQYGLRVESMTSATAINCGIWVEGASGATANYGIVLDSDLAAGGAIWFGDGQDATIHYDGTDLVISPAIVGTGELKVTGASIEVDSAEAMYHGDAATDGTWRTIRTGNDYVVERREAGAYVEKGRFFA